MLLNGLTPAEFLRGHWQKMPLLIRDAFQGFTTPLAPEELAGLACEADVESRLIINREKVSNWDLRHGPFKETDFTALPEARWTLLVQDVEKHLPELAWIPDRFDFIPAWRIDDLMVSYAAPEGTVGPHVDQYDVFLLQGLGRRRWQIDSRGTCYREHQRMELKLIEHFRPTMEWVLEPGDMLYLPPGVAHYGVALDDCMTYSVGFRAPSHRDMLIDFLEVVAERTGPAERYADPDLQPAEEPGRLDPAALSKARTALRDYLHPKDCEIDCWFGRFITEPKSALEDEPPARPLDCDELKKLLAEHGGIQRSAAARFAWFPIDQGGAELFVSGERYPLQERDLAMLLCRHRILSPCLLDTYFDSESAVNLLVTLYNAGHMVFENYE